MGLIKNNAEIDLIRKSCKLTGEVLRFIKDKIKPGVTTKEIDILVEEFIISKGGYPAFKGYKVGRLRFPGSACISVNDEVVHGLPGERKLEDGDIVSVDVGVKMNGYHGDSAFTFEVGEVNSKKKKLLRITEESLYKGIEQCMEGNTINDISCAIQNHVEGAGFGVVRELVGHGIGKELHEEPSVPNFYSPENNVKLRSGMVIAIEPMVNYGTYEVYTKKDGWTIVSGDNEPSAHFEHTVLITKSKPEILTAA